MTAIFVSGFDFDTSESAIAEHFETIGSVASIEFIGRGAAVLRFDNPAAASQAVDEKHETTIEGNRRYISVKFDGEKGEKGSKGGKKGKNGNGKGKGYSDSGKGGKGYEDHTSFEGEFQTGTIAKFLTDRGFGYITPDRGQADVFVHFSAIVGSGFRQLEEGQRVRFGVESDPKGKSKGSVRAVAVSVI